MKIIILALLQIMLVSTFAFAGGISAGIGDDGGMSGGGGGDIQLGRRIRAAEVRKILVKARREIYMLLSLESQNSTFPWPELFEGNPNIFQTLEKTAIYASREDCEDSFGQDKDGSAHSSFPDKICISVKRLSKKIKVDNARAQILSLVAHEYSHLQGFNETQAKALQQWLLPKFMNSSSDQSTNLLDYMTRQNFDAGDALSNYVRKPKNELSWDYLCFISEKIKTILTIIEQQATDKPFSVLDRELYRRQNSFLLKHIAITKQVCANSQYHPEKEYMQKWVLDRFQNKETLTDMDLVDILVSAEYDVRKNPLILGDLSIHRIHSFLDFDTEISEVENHLMKSLRQRNALLWMLEQPPIQLNLVH